MKRTNRKSNIHSEGFTLVMVMSVLVLLLILGLGLMNLGLQGQILAIRTGSQIEARTAADAGLTRALVEMNHKVHSSLVFDDSVLPAASNEALPNCDAAYSYAVTGNKSSGFAIKSVGRAGNQERTVGAILRLAGLFDFGILVKQSALLYSNTLVDGYDSSDSANTNILVQVASVNPDPHSVTLMPGAKVDGDILFGVDYDFPKVTAPVLPDVGAQIYAKGETVIFEPKDSGRYISMNLQGDTLPGVLVIDGGDVVLHLTGDVSMGQGSELVIKPGSSLTVFLDGNWIAGNSVGINNETKIPEKFMLYGTGLDQTFELKAKADWYGVIYAPQGDLSIKAKSDIYGSLVCNSFEGKHGGLIMYDSALRNVGIDDLGARFVIDRWSE